MQVHKIVAMFLVVLLIVLVVSCWPQITAALTTLNRLGPGHSSDDRASGLVSLMLIGAVLVAIVRILVGREK